MCGIVGFTGREDPDLIRSMCRKIHHRGPDALGFLERSELALGSSRLSIVDVDLGHQPACNENETVWTVFNGEIYNHRTLRSEMIQAGHTFRSDHSDTEIIVHLYEAFGEKWVTRINGMFAVAIWDAPEEKLLIYRDRLGKKPLYYAHPDHQIIFGSEIKALLCHPRVSRELDPWALRGYFSHKNIGSPRTCYRDIKQLMPGHMLIWRRGDLKIKPYWRPDFSGASDPMSEAEAADTVLDLLTDAVRLRMNCDVPYGAYLSGGLDSSLVTMLLSKQSSGPIKTFCLGYEDEPVGQFAGKARDRHFARRMAGLIGSDHYEFLLNADLFARMMPEVMAAFDQPFSGAVSTYFLSILMKKHVKVAISGDGADELFGSYRSHRLSTPLAYFLSLENRDRLNFESLSPLERERLNPSGRPEDWVFMKRLADQYGTDWRQGLAVFTENEQNRLLNRDFLAEARQAPLGEDESGNRYTARDMLNQTLEGDQNTLLPDQVLCFVDRLSMAHSIEVRCPFLDHRLVEFVNRLPASFKIRGAITKYLLKQAAAGLLPEDVVTRPKEGFVQPVYSWMKASLKAWTRSHLASLPASIFNMNYAFDLYNKINGKDDRVASQIWNLVCFNIWFHQKK